MIFLTFMVINRLFVQCFNVNNNYIFFERNSIDKYYMQFV